MFTFLQPTLKKPKIALSHFLTVYPSLSARLFVRTSVGNARDRVFIRFSHINQQINFDEITFSCSTLREMAIGYLELSYAFLIKLQCVMDGSGVWSGEGGRRLY